MADILRRNLINQCAKELSEYTTCSEFECQTIVANILSRNDAIEEMRGRQKLSTSDEALPIGDVGGNEVTLPTDDDVNTESALNMGRTLDMGKQ